MDYSCIYKRKDDLFMPRFLVFVMNVLDEVYRVGICMTWGLVPLEYIPNIAK